MMALVPTEHWDYKSTDVIRGLFTALASRRPDSRSDIQLPGLGSCHPVRSGRAAIVVALQSLGLAPGAVVGVPLYCCPVVFKAIKAAGCVPRFIDVDPRTYCLSADDLAAKSSKVDAVMAVHMFGNLCDVPALRSAAPGKPIVEDCAQALGSCLNGRPAGLLGEVAAFSFRSGKYLSVGEGGAVYCAESDLRTRVRELVAGLAEPNRVDELVHVVTTYLRSTLRTRPLWGLIGTRIWDVYNATTSYTSKSPLVLQQIYDTDRQMIARRLPLLESWIAKQRSNATYYEQNLRVGSEMLCSEPAGAFFNRLQYPLLLPTPDHCARLALRLKELEVSTARPYNDIAAISAAHYDYTGDCPNSERIAATVLVIPCHHALRPNDVERIAARVNRAWAETGGRENGVSARPHFIPDVAGSSIKEHSSLPNVSTGAHLSSSTEITLHRSQGDGTHLR